MIPETLDLRTSLILLSSQRITGQKTIEASKLEPLTTNRCRGQHLTLDDDTLVGSNKSAPSHSREERPEGWRPNLVERNEAVWRCAEGGGGSSFHIESDLGSNHPQLSGFSPSDLRAIIVHSAKGPPVWKVRTSVVILLSDTRRRHRH
jgi:hypothetical protein